MKTIKRYILLFQE